MDYVETLRRQIQAMGQGFVENLPALAIALAVLFVTWIIARFAVRISDAIFGRKDLRGNLRSLLDTAVKLAIWIAGLFIAAVVVSPGLTPASIFAGLGIGAVAIGFAFRDIFENFFAGVLLMLREHMRIGDVISCEDITGRIEHISLRETRIRQLTGELTLVPNSMLFKNPVEILTDGETRRFDVVVGVSYDANLDHAADVMARAVETVEGVLASMGVDVFAEEFAGSAVNFRVRWWASSSPRAKWESRDRVIRAIKAALDEEGIEMPYPYLTHTFKEPLPIVQLSGERPAGR